MWRRAALERLRTLWNEFPAVLILGARQVGKTTLARTFLPRAEYCDLEDPLTRRLFTEEPRFQLEARSTGPVILDEAQMVPDVFAALRGVIDAERPRRSRFCILGSAQPSLVRGVSESLAGRVGVLELDPLCAVEIQSGKPTSGWRDLWLKGGFPDALRGDFRTWWEAYLRMFAERDLPQLGIQPQPLLVRRLLTMLAHVHGGLLNMSEIARSLGVSHVTVGRYLDILEQTFLIRRLQPWFANVGKRLTKSPKVYLRDSGLLHHLLNISTAEELRDHPARGRSWEGFVLEDLVRREKLVRPDTTAWFWRTAAGAEADLVLDRGSSLVAIEIKAGALEHTDRVKRFAATLPDIGAPRGFIIDQGTGVRPLHPAIECRGFGDDPAWLP